MKEYNINFIDEKCPLCKTPILSDGVYKYCAFVGTVSYPPCPNGIANKILVNDTFNK